MSGNRRQSRPHCQVANGCCELLNRFASVGGAALEAGWL